MSSLAATGAALLGDDGVRDLSQFTFSAVDYVLFALMLCVSLGIGIYFGFFDKSERTTEEYLFGGKRIKALPIAISLVASQMSGMSIMAIPAEIYVYGINWLFSVLSMLVIVPLLCWIVIPVFYNNNISNCYEYLEKRFNSQLRELLTLAFIFTLIFLLPVIMFVPASAFSQVSGINVHLINTVVCSICVFYTMFGGLKAVVWTDVVQAAIMVVSLVLVGLLGVSKVGSFAEVFRIAAEGRRLTVNFSFDATTRATFWNCLISSTVLWTSYVGLNQSCVQRITALPTLAQAKRSLIIFGFGFMLIMTFNCLMGIVMYARYAGCDPLGLGLVATADRLVPFFVQDIMGHLKGMPGVFISCIFSASLSTMSAGLNSLAGIVYLSYIKPHIRHTERRAYFAMKTLVFLMGIYCILAGVVVERFSSILQTIYSITGITFGAIFAVFLMGMLVPRAHGRAVLFAVASSVVTMLVIVVCARGRANQDALLLSTEKCPRPNTTTTFIDSPLEVDVSEAESTSETIFNILDISFNWYVVLGGLIVFVVGIPLSYILPGADKETGRDPKLFSSIIHPFVQYQLAAGEDLPKSPTKADISY